MNAHRERFCEIIDFAVPWADGVAVMLVAHFDASQRTRGDFCVAGIAFSPTRAKKATKAWRALWGDTPCHMTDLHTRKKGGAFHAWTSEEAGKRLVESIALINRYSTYSVAVSCDLAEISRLAPNDCAPGSEQFLNGFRTAYAVCCQMGMSVIGRLVEERGKDDGGVAYFFESGDLHQAQAQSFISWVTSVPPINGVSPMKKNFQHVSHTVMAKAESRLFEMSDILAWEWAKHRERLRENPSKPMRGSLKALLGDGRHGPNDFASATTRAMHLTGDPLANYFDKIKGAVLSEDEVAAPLLRAYLTSGSKDRGRA